MMTMENDNNTGGFHVYVYSSGNNIAQTITQTYNGNVYNGKEETNEKPAEKKTPSQEQLARAIETCQEYFWANAAYAVVYCICRDDYKMKLSQTDFETMVEALPYKNERDYKCTTGTIANAFCNNLIFSENIGKWDGFNPLPRIIKLRDALRNELKL